MRCCLRFMGLSILQRIAVLKNNKKEKLGCRHAKIDTAYTILKQRNAEPCAI